VKTSHARNRIRAWLRRQRQSENIARGRELLAQECERHGYDAHALLRSDKLLEAARSMNYATEEDLLAGVGFGTVGAGAVLQKLRPQEKPREEIPTARPIEEARLRLSAGGVDDVFFRRARCCSALPGDEVVGHVSRGRGMAIHLRECPNLQALLAQEPDRVQNVEWAPPARDSSDPARFDVRVQLEAIDRSGLLQDITSVLTERKIFIVEHAGKGFGNNIAVINLTIRVASRDDLEDLLRVLGSAVPDVVAAYRVGGKPGRKAARL
jgi:GTP pyrophosphokinase